MASAFACERLPVRLDAAATGVVRRVRRGMRWVLMFSVAVVLAGCAGGSRGADETARAWVDAINAAEWDRACELSVKESQQECVTAASAGFGDAQGEMRIEGVYRSGETTKFAVTTPQTRSGGKEVDGWTAYGPAELAVERHDGEYLVHFEATGIR